MSDIEVLSPEISPQVEYIYENLEKPNWAPWLRFSPEQMAIQGQVYPKGQLTEYDEGGNPIAVLATNRINWDGESEHLPTWDDVAGINCDFSDTYKISGNTLVLMSMSIDKDQKGQHLPEKLVSQLKDLAKSQEAQHIIGDFRPNGFNAYKLETGDYSIENYLSQRREDGLPIDGWIRNVTRMGMNQLKLDKRAMVVPASMDEFESYRSSFMPESWHQVQEEANRAVLVKDHQPQLDIGEIDEVWECGQTGSWYLNRNSGKAVYIESNLWGELPI